MIDADPARALALWPLPLLAAALPTLAAVQALLLYAGDGGLFCNPFIDDCVSISRMARHGLANHVFRALVLPGAVLQLMTWLVAAHALAHAGAARRDAVLLALVGTIAGTALVVYGSFLGTEGDVYRWLRRWGTLAYFAGTWLALLLFARATPRLDAAHPLAVPRRHRVALVALPGFVTLASLAHVAVAGAAHGTLEDRIENLTEWWGALALMLGFATMAALWRHWGLAAQIAPQAPRAPLD